MDDWRSKWKMQLPVVTLHPHDPENRPRSYRLVTADAHVASFFSQAPRKALVTVAEDLLGCCRAGFFFFFNLAIAGLSILCWFVVVVVFAAGCCAVGLTAN